MRFLLLLSLLFSVGAAAQSTGSRVDSYVFTVTSGDPLRVEKNDASPRIVSYKEVRCFNLTATPVFFGGPSLAVYPICTDAAVCLDGPVLSLATQNLYATVASTSVDITCIFLR